MFWVKIFPETLICSFSNLNPGDFSFERFSFLRFLICLAVLELTADERTIDMITESKSVSKSKILILSPQISLQAYLAMTGTKLKSFANILYFEPKGFTEAKAQVNAEPT